MRRPSPARSGHAQRSTGAGRFGTVVLAWVVTAWLLVGCSGPHPRPDDAIATTDAVYPKIDERLESIDTMRIEARADYYDEKRGERVVGRDVNIVSMAPDKLRITLGSGFNSVLASLASDGTDFTMLDMVNRAYFFGPATVENLSQLLPIYLSGSDFVRVLAGGFPTDDLVDDWRADVPVGWNEKTGHYRLELDRVDGGVQVVELTYPGLAVARLEIRGPDGAARYRYEAKDFADNDGRPYPGKSRFTFIEQDQDVTLFIDSWKHDVEINERIFTIRAPAGVDQYQLGAE